MKKQNIFIGGFRFLLISFFSLAFFSCARVSNEGSLAFSLKNGIPVYYKSVDSTKMASVIICVKGGTLMFGRDYSGIESRLFELMSRGSQKYSYDDLQRLAYDKHISISRSSAFSGSFFELSCISNYLDQALDAFLDCFLRPSFDQTQFDNMMTECDQGLQRMQNDPQSLLFYTINKEIYKDHPLGTSASVLPESRSNITMQNLKEHYAKILDAKRIFVVAAGDVNLRKLRRALEKSLGKVAVLNDDFSLPQIPPLKIAGPKISLATPTLPKGSGHIAVAFKSPAIGSPDLPAARIAALAYDQSLFNIVRTKYGACYTPSTSVGFSPAPCGFVFLFRVSDMKNAATYLPEAEDDFLNGDLEPALLGYVKKYVSSAYQNQTTCASIAGRSASALLAFDDIDGFDKIAEKTRALTAEEVKKVFKEYWLSNDKRIFEIFGN